MNSSRENRWNKRIGRTFLALAVLASNLSFSPALSAEDLSSFAAIISRFELKEKSGGWVTVIEPDRRVDFSRESAEMSFFNNGRVPPGEYVNFRISFYEKTKIPGLSEARSVELAADFSPLEIKKGSFVYAALVPKPDGAGELQLTVDEQSLRFGEKEFRLNA